MGVLIQETKNNIVVETVYVESIYHYMSQYQTAQENKVVNR